MKKILVLILLLLLIAVGVNLFKNKIGDIKTSEPKVVEQTAVAKFTLFVSGLDRVRDLEFSPGGTLLASIMSESKIVAIPQVDRVIDVITGLNNPHGIAFYKDKLFVAEETRVTRYSWDEKNLRATFEKKLFDLPKGGRHTTRTLDFDKNGKLYVVTGSTCDVCFERDPHISVVLISDEDGNNPRVFAKGLRNSVFITVNPKTDELWGTEMGRDFLGDDLPPDEVNIIRDGRDYGWPVCYGDRVYDSNFGQKNPDYCQNTEAPVYKIAAHSAPLGLAFHNDYLYLAYHGSWNRSTPIGYKIVRLKLDGNTVSPQEETIIDFESGERGRPVDMVFDKFGAMFVSDDKQGVIYKVDFQK